jgi:peptide deformylase
MAIRTILHYPDKRLRDPGKPVTDFGADFQKLVDDMAETMYAAPGVGLAATQIGEAKRLFIIDVATGDDEPSDLRVFVNPEILERNGEVRWEEGCLSYGERLWASLMELAQIGATPKGGVCRLTLTDLDKQGRDLVQPAGRARPA